MKKFSRSQKKNFLKKLPLGLAVVFFLIVAGVIAWQYRAELAARVYGSRQPLGLPFINQRNITRNRATFSVIPPSNGQAYKSWVQIPQQEPQPIIPRYITLATMKVTLPNQDAANQNFVQGTKQLITWKSTGSAIPPITISLHNTSNSASYNALISQLVSGSYQWTVPSDFSGNGYYINVKGINSSGGTVNGQSKLFNIVTQSSAAAPRCGDGIVQAERGEECDGSTSQGAVCTRDCRKTKVGLVCPSWTVPAKTTRFTLTATNPAQAGATIRNGMSVPAGTYAIGVRSGSISYWPLDNVDTTNNSTAYGGGPGKTWAVLADVAYWKDGRTIQTRVSQYPPALYANMQDPWFNDLVGAGRLLYINSNHPAHQNLFVFLMDDTGSVADNRGSEEIELIKCE